jgi:hypothetical protein
MELLVFVAVFVLLAALSSRFGVDSRDDFQSHEAELAARGFSREQRVPVHQQPWTR